MGCLDCYVMLYLQTSLSACWKSSSDLMEIKLENVRNMDN